MSSNLLLPHIACPTRVTVNSQTLIDNIFSNNYDSSFASGNVETTLSDHHAQFLLIELQTKQMDHEKNQMFRDFSKIENNKNLVNTHLEGIDWATQVNRNNADLSSELLLKEIEQLINFWTPLQRVSNKKKKSQNEPWVTKGLINLLAIGTKNKLYRKMCRAKNPLKREELVNKEIQEIYS